MDVVFGILGRTALRIGGDLHEDWGPPRVRAVLATLLVHAGRAVSIDTLLDWAWPEETPTPQNPAATFHTYATRIRRWLRRLSPPSELRASNGSYRLEVDKSLIDYHRFQALITHARTHARGHDPQRAVEYAEQALELWRGPPLDDLSSETARAWRTRVIQDEWLPANTTLLEALLAIEEPGQVLARLNDLQSGHPDNISLAKLRMSALHDLSRPAEATAYYFTIRRRLLDDADEQAAEHLRRHHENLRLQTREPDPTQLIRPRQLPHDVDFVGRGGLLRALDAVTATPGVVILDGMAGVGKTALAVHWGHLVRHRFPDGDFFVNLNGFSDDAFVEPSTVVDDFLTALGYPPDGNLTRRARELLLSRLLSNRRILVILDNARNTDHIKDLVALLSGCLVLVTSRQRLTTLSATTGARRVRVEPMPPPEAAELLSARLGQHHPIDDEDRTRLIDLCGGLPLVITVLADHLAAGGTAHLSGFAHRLHRRHVIVDVGDDDGSAVAHTFFMWSYRALPPPERRLFRLLGLHPGPDVNVDVACACDGRTPEETRRSFGTLVGAHLLERPEVLDRYRFHDLLREFARYCAERDEPPESRRAAERRMIAYYLAAATRAHQTLYPGLLTPPALPIGDAVEPVAFSGPDQARLWFDQERTNLTAAIHYAAAHGYHDFAWRLADTTATFLDRQGNLESSRAVREVAVACAAKAGDDEGHAANQAGLGAVLIVLGEHALARQYLDAALRFAEDTGNELGQGSTLHQLARLEMDRGDPAAAVRLYQRCLDLAQRLNEPEGLTWTHCRLGQALRILQQHDLALVHLNQSQFHAQRIDNKMGHASSLAEIGLVHRDRGDHHSAAAYCEQALHIVENLPIPDRAITIQICTALAEINLARSDVRSALEFGLRAATLARRTHNAPAEAHALDVVGDIYAHHADPRDAILTWRQAAEIFQRIGNAAGSAAVHAKVDGVSARDDDTPSGHSASA